MKKREEKLLREDIQMNSDDYEIYWMPACVNILGFVRNQISHTEVEAMGIEMGRLLGVTIEQDYWHRYALDDAPIPDDWRAFLKLLAGPYGKAFLKAYQIKYGVKV